MLLVQNSIHLAALAGLRLSSSAIDYLILLINVKPCIDCFLQLNFIHFVIVPDLDQAEQQLHELGQVVLGWRLEHQLFDEVHHLVNYSNSDRQVSHDHHPLQTLLSLPDQLKIG